MSEVTQFFNRVIVFSKKQSDSLLPILENIINSKHKFWIKEKNQFNDTLLNYLKTNDMENELKVICKYGQLLNLNVQGVITLLYQQLLTNKKNKNLIPEISFSSTHENFFKNNKTKQEKTEKQILNLISTAEESIILFIYNVTNEYNQIILQLKRAIYHKNINATIIASYDVMKKIKFYFKELDISNIKFYTSRNKSQMHAKVIVKDNSEAIITSANLTNNGMIFNLEIGVQIKGKEVNNLIKFINELIASPKIKPVNLKTVKPIHPDTKI